MGFVKEEGGEQKASVLCATGILQLARAGQQEISLTTTSMVVKHKVESAGDPGESRVGATLKKGCLSRCAFLLVCERALFVHRHRRHHEQGKAHEDGQCRPHWRQG